MSSYTTRANGIIVILYRQTRYFWCCVVKQLPDFSLIHFSKTFSHFVFTTNRIWSDSLLVEEPIKLHNSSYTVFVYIIILYIWHFGVMFASLLAFKLHSSVSSMYSLVLLIRCGFITILLRCAVLYCILFRCVVLRCVALCCVVSCCVVLCRVVSCCSNKLHKTINTSA